MANFNNFSSLILVEIILCLYCAQLEFVWRLIIIELGDVVGKHLKKCNNIWQIFPELFFFLFKTSTEWILILHSSEIFVYFQIFMFYDIQIFIYLIIFYACIILQYGVVFSQRLYCRFELFRIFLNVFRITFSSAFLPNIYKL